MTDPRAYAKALAALLVSALVAALTAWQAASSDGMTDQDWATVILAALAPVAVYLTPNRSPQ